MNVMIQKETEDNGLYMQVLSTEELPNPRVAFNKRRLIAKTNKGEFVTAYYYNYCLCCIDSICYSAWSKSFCAIITRAPN